MTDLEALRITALIAWVYKYNKTPNQITEQNDKEENSVECEGSASKTSINLRLGYETLRTELSEEKNAIVGKYDNSYQVVCQLDSNGQEVQSCRIKGGPGEIQVDNISSNRVSVSWGSSKYFEIS